jgi:hypothetical protein
MVLSSCETAGDAAHSHRYELFATLTCHVPRINELEGLDVHATLAAAAPALPIQQAPHMPLVPTFQLHLMPVSNRNCLGSIPSVDVQRLRKGQRFKRSP